MPSARSERRRPFGPARPAIPVLLAAVLLLSACTDSERKDIRLTPTATAEPSVRIVVDNCPGPDVVSLSVRDELLWQIESTEPAADAFDSADDVTLLPGLLEFQVGQAPEGWRTAERLAAPLQEGIRYTVATEPDGKSIDFSLPDLSPGLLFDGEGGRQFAPNILDVRCEAQADLGAFTRNLAVLGALWVTSAALVLVALITLLFLITRRFSRIRSIERRTARQIQSDARRDEADRTPV